MLSRRQALIGAAASSLILPPACARPRGGGGGGQVWRASGQNMRQTVQGYTGGVNWSCCTISRHYSNVPFRYARFVVALFDNLPVSPSFVIADKDFANNMAFQIGLEYPFNASYAGIPARIPVNFSGSSVLNYSTSGGPFGFAVSDIVDFGGVVPAGAPWRLWTTNENANGAGSPSNTLPYQANGSENYQAGYQRFQGSVIATSSLISAGTALTAGSFTPYGSAQYGSNSSFFAPCMMLLEAPSTAVHVFGIGDSIMNGIGEGGNGSSTYGDSMGSVLANAGYPARWIFETLGHNFVNLGRGSDGYKYFSAANWKYRLQLLSLANPTHVLMQNSHNDISAGNGASTIGGMAAAAYLAVRLAAPQRPIIAACCTPDSGGATSPAWAAANNYAAGAIIAGPYICRIAGSSASSGSGPSGHGTGIADGGVVWDYILAGALAAQTASSGWGGSGSHRGAWNDTYIRSAASPLGNAGWIDVNPALESGYIEGNAASETSLWNVPRGVAYDLTIEGTHPNSYGASLAAGGMVSSVGGATVADPFLAC